MPNRRYHIHVICVAHDQTLVLDALAVFFQARAFVTYDVASSLPKAALYGRYCIDACNYTIVIVGDNYGAPQNIGASQMHLSYLSAKTKLKPMLVLIKTHSESSRLSKQLQNFTRLVEQQVNHVYYYDESTNIEKLLAYAYDNMVASQTPTSRWVKVNETLESPTSYTKTPSTAIKNVQRPAQSYLGTDAEPNPLKKPLELTDTFQVQYSVQAYEGGNLTDVMMTMLFTWQELLQALAQIPVAFSSYGLQSCINRLITTRAEEDVKQCMPNVHAVSRCQVVQPDLAEIQRLLIGANWIQLISSSARTSQELWKLTFHAKNLLQQS